MNTTRLGLLETPVPPAQQSPSSSQVARIIRGEQSPSSSQVAEQDPDADLDPAVMPVSPPQEPHYSQVSVEGIARQMLAGGYDPSVNKLQAVADMQAVNIPQSVINHVLEIADRQIAENKRAAAAAASFR